MKKMNPLKKNPPSLNAFRGGSYSLIISAVVLALLVVANVFASALPSAMTKYDISSTKLYSVTSNTKVVVNALEQDVTIYWIVQSGKEDDIIENLLSKYETLSGHIKVVKKNPDVFPTFTEQYTNETVQNNSLIVECGDRSRFIGYDDIYIQEADVYSYSYNTSFDGEGAITSAIDYVVSEELPQLYMLEGHGEAELPATFSEQIEKENIEVSSFSLLTVDSVPEEADCVLIYAPTAAMTMYDMARVNANGYFDSENTADARYAKKQAMNIQRIEDYKNGSYALAGGVVDPLPEDAPQFVKDYHSYYKTRRGYHPRSLNSGSGWNVTSSLPFINMPILQYSSEIRSAVLLVHGEKAHSRYFSEGAYEKLTGDNKELIIIPGANHVDLYDSPTAIPFEKLKSFFEEYLK